MTLALPSVSEPIRKTRQENPHIQRGQAVLRQKNGAGVSIVRHVKSSLGSASGATTPYTHERKQS